MLVICQCCGVEFKTKPSRIRKFCSVECSRKIKAAKTVVCACCGIETTNEKYCSRNCAATINGSKFPKRVALPGGRRKYIIETPGVRPSKCHLTCEVCNSDFVGHPSRKFCSNTCSQQKSFAKVHTGDASSKTVKRYLISIHGSVCLNPNCAWDFTKVPITVDLEHIDGNSENNALSNCTLLCPNCHSLTPTYKGRNKGTGRAKRRDRYKKGLSYWQAFSVFGAGHRIRTCDVVFVITSDALSTAQPNRLMCNILAQFEFTRISLFI